MNASLRSSSKIMSRHRDPPLLPSIGGSFGSLVHVPELGIVLNNAMQNFDPRPDHPNAIKPGKMPIFAAPVLVAAPPGGRGASRAPTPAATASRASSTTRACTNHMKFKELTKISKSLDLGDVTCILPRLRGGAAPPHSVL